jgi:hypothetical protein
VFKLLAPASDLTITFYLPLCLAARYGQLSILEFCLNNPDNPLPQSALDVAVTNASRYGQVAALHLLLPYLANASNQSEAVRAAAINSHWSVVDVWLDHPQHVYDATGALCETITNGELNRARRLIPFSDLRKAGRTLAENHYLKARDQLGLLVPLEIAREWLSKRDTSALTLTRERLDSANRAEALAAKAPSHSTPRRLRS